MSTILECKNLSKAYGNKTALSHIDLALEGGHIIGLLGPNGSGKTTLIKLINGLLTPSEGELYIDQNPVGIESKKIVSYLPDHTYLESNLKVREIIDYFKDFYDDFDEIRAYDMLAKLQINPSDKLKAMSKDRIILLISHRLYLFDQMDQVIWMENGQTQTGTHEKMLQIVPEYANLCKGWKEGADHA